MKKFLLVVFCTIFTLGAFAKHEMVFVLKDGTTHVFLFEEEPDLRITLDQVVLSSSSLNATYLFSEIKSYAIIDTETSVNSAEGAAFSCRFIDGVLTMSGCKKAEVFNAEGKFVKAQTLDGEGNDCSLNLSNVPSGVYVVKTNAKTFKITKK